METINSRQNQRGQAFVIGAILISVLVIGTAVSLNLYLFTESSTEPVSGESSVDTVAHINTLEQEQRTLLHKINEQQYEQRTQIDSAVNDSMNTIYTAEKYRMYDNGIQYQGTIDPTYGVLIEQPTRGFDSPTDSPNWDIISSSESLRDASFTFETSSLPATRTGQTELIFNNSSGTYRYIPTYVGGDTVVLYQNPGLVFSETCSVNTTESTIEIDFRENTINGDSCPELGNVSMGQDHTLSVENGQASTTGSFAVLYEGLDSSVGSSIGTNSSAPNYAHKVLRLSTESSLLYREGSGTLNPVVEINRESYNSRGDYFDT